MVHKNLHGFAHLVLLFVIVLLVGLMFVPIPHYNSKGDAYCMSLDCPKPGWSLGPSLAQQFLNRSGSIFPEEGSSTVPAETESESPTTASNPTAGWETYINEKYGFSISYPTHLHFEEAQNSWEFSYGDPTGPDWENSFWMSLIITKGSLNQYLENNLCEGKNSSISRVNSLYQACMRMFNENKQSHTIAGVEAIISTWSPYENELAIIIFENDGYVYDIRHTTEEVPKGYELAIQVLSTFEFTEAKTGTCVHDFETATNTFELTFRQDHSLSCSEKATKSECGEVDIIGKALTDPSGPDGIPDCKWTTN